MTESLQSTCIAAETMQVEENEAPLPDDEKKIEPEETSDIDSASVSSTETDNSDSDDLDTEKTKDPELLLIKATNLKDEGNSYFKSQDYEKALRCYRRGTSALKSLNKANTGDPQVKSLLVSLQSNLSMMYFKVNKYKQSAVVASSVLKIEADNVKALYRRAVANRKLGEYTKARDDLRQALKHDATNSAIRKELASIKQLVAKQKTTERQSMQKAFSKGGLLYDDKEEEKRRRKKAESEAKRKENELKAKRKKDWEDECVRRMARGESACSFEEYEKELKKLEDEQNVERQRLRQAELERRRMAAKANNNDSDDSDEEIDSRLFRGYKKTSDGRITSYFTREQSEEEKLLAAERNAPKRLDSAQVDSVEHATSGSTLNSAWNVGGTTWEEKDCTGWCSNQLKQRLKETKVESAFVCGFVTDATEMTGDSSVALVSGKKRYIFDFHCTIKYDIRDRSSEEIVASGSMKLPDICSTHHEELEVLVEQWTKKPKENTDAVKECRYSLVSEVRESVKLWVKDFNEAY